MGDEDLFQRWESSACGHQDRTASDLVLLAVQDVNDRTEARRGGLVRSFECVCDEGLGFGELEVSGGVVGLSCAGVGCTGDGDLAAVEHFDCGVFVGDVYEGSPAGVDADSYGGAAHLLVLGDEATQMPIVVSTSVVRLPGGLYRADMGAAVLRPDMTEVGVER